MDFVSMVLSLSQKYDKDADSDRASGMKGDRRSMRIRSRKERSNAARMWLKARIGCEGRGGGGREEK